MEKLCIFVKRLIPKSKLEVLGAFTLFCYKYSEVVAEDGACNFEGRVKSLKLLKQPIIEVVLLKMSEHYSL